MQSMSHLKPVEAKNLTGEQRHSFDAGGEPIDFVSLSVPARVVRRQPFFFEGPGCGSALASFNQAAEMFSVGCYRVRDATVLGDGVVVHAGRILVGPELEVHVSHLVNGPPWHCGLQANRNGTLSADSKRMRSRIEGKAALLMKGGHRVFGHWLVDILPRLSILDSVESKKLPLIVAEPLRPWARALLELLGVSTDRLKLIDPFREYVDVEELYLPTMVRRANHVSRFLLHPYKQLDARFGREGAHGAHEDATRLYISRGAWKNRTRCLINRECVKKVLQSHGFTEYFPERCSIAEQIRILRSAECVMGEDGSGLHATLFAQQNLRVGVLIPEGSHHFLQGSLGDLRGHSTGFLFGRVIREGHTPGDNRYQIDIENLDNVLRRNFH